MLLMESTSAQTTKEVSVRVALKRAVWEGRATVRACFSEAMTTNWQSRGASSDCEVVGEMRAPPREGRLRRRRAPDASSRSRESGRSFHCSLSGSISPPLLSRNETDRIGPFSRNMLPLGEAMTGCVCLESRGTLREMASTDPRWVPTQRLGDVDASAREKGHG